MKAIKLAIYTLLASVILTSCIKNKQQSTIGESTTEDVFEIADIQNTDDDFSIDTLIVEDSSNTIDITTDCLPVDDNTTVYVDTISNEKVFTSVDVMPEFTGGAIAMKNFFKDNLSSNLDNQGRVVVRFVVDSKGNIKGPTVLRSLSPDCDKEAIRVIKKMPQWTPGKKKGETVSVYYTLPVLFKSDK